jgi:hypothetical protein
MSNKIFHLSVKYSLLLIGVLWRTKKCEMGNVIIFVSLLLCLLEYYLIINNVCQNFCLAIHNFWKVLGRNKKINGTDL